MKISIAITGPAWSWINTVWIMLSKMLSKKWYEIYGDKEYESKVRWWSNIFTVYISDDTKFISKNIDYLISFDQASTDKYKKVYNIENTIQVPNSKEISYKNIYSLWMITKLLNINIDTAKKQIKSKFDKKYIKSNFKDLTKWYNNPNIVQRYNLKDSLSNSKTIASWNEIIWKWAIQAWMDFYAAYPMTPASSIIETITQYDQVTFFQWEDEIACSMTMLWAKFSGKRAMTGTSWWGFALMTESIWYSIQAEIGGVFVLSQRAGPSTWTPTYTEQGNINFAINSHFGWIKPIVLAPYDLYNGHYLISKALNFSDKYQHPIIVLIDKQYSENFGSIDSNYLKIAPIDRGKLKNNPDKNFARYSITKDSISPRTIPWQSNGEYNASSYEHSKHWATSENPNTKIQNDQKRKSKIKTFIENEFGKDFQWYQILNPKASKFIISLWANKIAIENFLKNNKQRWAILITCLNPLNPELKNFLDKNTQDIKKLVFVELNKQWQLQDHLSSKLDLNCQKRANKVDHYRKSNLYPLFQEDLKENLGN